VVDIILKQERTAEFIAQKLWRAFVSHDDTAAIGQVAKVFRDSDYDIGSALREVLGAEAFVASTERGTLIKSPVDLTVGTLRAFGVYEVEEDDEAMMNDEMEEGEKLVKFCRLLGQDLFDPPNVKGWPGGARWISTTTFMVRQRGMRQVARNKGIKQLVKKRGLGALFGAPDVSGADARALAIDVMLGRAPVVPLPDPSEGDMVALQAISSDPAYQMR